MTAHANQNWPVNSTSDTSLSRYVLRLIFKNYQGSFLIKLWDDSLLRIGNGAAAFTIALKHAKVPRDLILFRDPLQLAEAYFDGEVEVEGDFNAAMGLRYYLENLKLPFRDKWKLIFRALIISWGEPKKLQLTGRLRSLSRPNDSDSIAFHYDVSNDFYQLWLDKRMVYSCAYFESSDMDLDTAQCHKLDYICRKLRLQPGETLLDIGCGWGALACWAAKHYGVNVHGITLSRSQFEYARKEVGRLKLENQVTIAFCDYRDLSQGVLYDKVASVGMFEHVGLKNLPEYFSIVRRVLKPQGLFLNHGITTDEPDWKSSVSTRLINRHVFPDGELDTISNIQGLMEKANFEIFDVEGLRPHYAKTLRHWVDRLEKHHDKAVQLVGERTYRIWRLYMTGSALQFEQGSTGIYQILATGRAGGLPPLPLTRRDLYESN
jgi:cyclopropane-fatty-acyl-phospholipid synthase